MILCFFPPSYSRSEETVLRVTEKKILVQGKEASVFTITQPDNAQESKLHAMTPLPKRAVDKKLTVELGGNMQEYIWTLNGQNWPEVTPLVHRKPILC